MKSLPSIVNNANDTQITVTHLRHGISHAQVVLLANRRQMVLLKTQEGRRDLFDLRAHD
jgi:hypothetical protein